MTIRAKVSYKSPSSHHTVTIADAIEACETLIRAGHLLRVIENYATDLGRGSRTPAFTARAAQALWREP
jgi:hypothetical protein